MTITAAVLLVSTLCLQQVGPPVAEPAVEPKVAAEQIEAALKQGSAPAVAAIGKHGGIADRAVTKAVGGALKHKEAAVRLAAIKALRFNEDKSAFTELYNQRHNKRIHDDATSAQQYFLALGQHADKRALPYLLQDLQPHGRRDPVLTARVLAIGRIKDRAAIDGLVKFLRAHRRSDATDAAMVALVALTGNTGPRGGAIGWARWWKEHRAGFEFPSKAPELNKQQARIWTATWQRPGSAPVDDKAGRRRKGKKRE